MSRISKEDLESQFRCYVEALKREGLDVEGIKLYHGSKVNGNAYAVRMDGSTGPGTQFSGFIGWTKREAYDALGYMTRVIEDIRYYRTSE